MEPILPDEPVRVLEPDNELVDDLSALIDGNERGMVLNLIADLHPADLCPLLTHLPFDEARILFSWLDADVAGDVLSDLDDDFRADLLDEVPHARIAKALDSLPSDDAADILADLPDHVAENILPSLEDHHEVRTLLAYDEDTAGGIMARELVAVPPEWTVAEATEEVRRNAETVEEVYVLFVVDPDRRPIGFVSLKRLLLSRSGARIGDIMNAEIITVTTDEDQEEVARVMERYDLVSLAVVDGGGSLAGRITIDDVVDVIREEAEEDIQRLSGVAGGEEPTDSALRVSQGRLPWLVIGMVGAGVAAIIVGYFQGALQQATILASFIPVVMSTAGNAGIQSSSIAVQGLASGDVWSTDLARRLGKEILVALINGLSVAVVIAGAILLMAYVWPDLLERPAELALTAGLSLIIVVLMATTIGATIPLVLDKMGIDPALATGPFITTSNDILGILVFFSLATALYL